MLVAVTIRGNDFHDRSHQRKLLDTTDATGEICDTAKRLFVELRDGQTPLRLLGVSLTDLTHREEVQMSLFEDNHKRSRKLDKAMDPIWDIFGADTIMWAGAICPGKNVGCMRKARIELKKRGAVNIMLFIPAYSSFEIVLQSVQYVGIMMT